jgi:hypothetical protein
MTQWMVGEGLFEKSNPFFFIMGNINYYTGLLKYKCALSMSIIYASLIVFFFFEVIFRFLFVVRTAQISSSHFLLNFIAQFCFAMRW